MILRGGRGSQSGYSTFEFSHANDIGGNTKASRQYPAKMNVQTKTKTYDSALKTFQKKHQKSDHEFAVEVDPQGYFHQYVEGGKHSVGISGTNKNYMILHNHPGGGNFSDADLLTTASNARSGGIVATGSKGATFSIRKTGHFKANDFMKAVKKASLRGQDYDHAVDNWLTANQKKYGYKYTSQGYTNPSRNRKK